MNCEEYVPLGDVYGCQCMGPNCKKCGICIHSHKDGSVLLPSAPLTYKKCDFEPKETEK